MICLLRCVCVWKIQNTLKPVDKNASEYISVVLSGSEGARRSSLASRNKMGKGRHSS
jgi:hypothetical protein